MHSFVRCDVSRVKLAIENTPFAFAIRQKIARKKRTLKGPCGAFRLDCPLEEELPSLVLCGREQSLVALGQLFRWCRKNLKRKNRNNSVVAEGVGFEPTVDLRPRRFSRPVP